MNNPIEFFKSLFKNKKTTLTGKEVLALQYLHPEKGAINTGDYCTTQDIANLSPPYTLPANISVDSISELNSWQGIDIGPAVVYDNFFMMKATKQLQADVIDETTTNGGVTIEGVLLKDGKVNPLYPKIYKAILTQTGTNDPVATVLNENDSNYLGNLTWKRYSTGEFGASKNGVSSTNTSFIASSNFGASSSDLVTIQVSCSNNVIYFATYVSGVFKDGINQMFVTIEYYGA